MFVAEQISEYRELTGAIGGTLWIGDDANGILGDVQPGNAFLYLFRRFGYPILGWDGYKSAVDYILTTPRADTFLRVKIGAIVQFGYQITPELDKELNDEIFLPHYEWERRAYEWGKDQNPDLLHPIISDWNSDADLERVSRAWLRDNHPYLDYDSEIDEAVTLEFWKWVSEIHSKTLSTYSEKVEAAPDVHREPVEGSELWDVHQALLASVRDLLRPVNIRDALIDIRGQIKEALDDLPLELPPVVEPFKFAGYGVGTETLELLAKWKA